MTDLAQVLVERFEGCRLKAYEDTLGKWTIGWGHLLSNEEDWSGYTITQLTADEWLQEDLGDARVLAEEFPYFPNLNEVRQAVLTSMCFQMGGAPLRWPSFMAALEAEDYTAAAAAGRDSEWYRQTPARAEAEMTMLDIGTYQ